jgi:hypothetical protein
MVPSEQSTALFEVAAEVAAGDGAIGALEARGAAPAPLERARFPQSDPQPHIVATTIAATELR